MMADKQNVMIWTDTKPHVKSIVYSNRYTCRPTGKTTIETAARRITNIVHVKMYGEWSERLIYVQFGGQILRDVARGHTINIQPT